ncbi:hypothetical protein MASR2M15_27680 [Anaerolineales bacterium]
MAASVTWQQIIRILIKAIFIFALCNLIFALAYPLDFLASVSLYNHGLRGRERLPYSENPAASNSIRTDQIPAMLASHTLSAQSPAEYRVLLVGDSNTWGWFLPVEDSLGWQLEQQLAQSGADVAVYNIGYPVLALLKDLMLMDAVLGTYDFDAIVWLVTLDSFLPEKQLIPPLVYNNPEAARRLIDVYHLPLERDDPAFHDLSFWDKTLIGSRRELADLLRLQTYAFAWQATGIDQAIPAEIPLRKSDFEASDLAWAGYKTPVDLQPQDLMFDGLAAGLHLAGDTPLYLINEPIFISAGLHSELRYNSWYPRWAYDAYRLLLADWAAQASLVYVDLWDAIAADHFTDSPVHLDAAGTEQLAHLLSNLLADAMIK